MTRQLVSVSGRAPVAIANTDALLRQAVSMGLPVHVRVRTIQAITADGSVVHGQEVYYWVNPDPAGLRHDVLEDTRRELLAMLRR